MNKILITFVLSILLLSYTSTAFAVGGNKLVPPKDFQAFDTPNDGGKSITLRWPASPSEADGIQYVVNASTNINGPFETEVLRIGSNTIYEEGSDSRYHLVNIEPDKFFNNETADSDDSIAYFFKLVITSNPDSASVGVIASATPNGNWFNWSRSNNFIIMIIFSILILCCIQHAKRVPGLFIRKIKGLDAIDDALGRATEMGKPALFVHGLNDMDSISTIAA
jgi:hypothetical protein